MRMKADCAPQDRCIEGTVTVPGVPLALLGTPGATPHAGRAMGKDNHEVFCQLLGLTETECMDCLASGVIQRQ